MINMFRALLVALGLLVPVQAQAGVPCTLPFTFANGQIADATQVNANYNALVACLNNAAAAGVNFDITTITGLTTPLSTSQGGTSVGTHTTDGVLYGQGTGAIGSARCTMSANQAISCVGTAANFPQFVQRNTAADATAAFVIFDKNRAAGNTNNADAIGNVLWRGFANSGQQNAAQLGCTQVGASVGANIPTRCAVLSTTAGGQLATNFAFPLTNGAANSIAVSDGSGNVSWSASVPTKQYLTASGTYTTPAGARTIFIQECGGGAGGGAAITNSGTNGNATTFNGITANGGTNGKTSGAGSFGGAGGTGGAGAASLRVNGTTGTSGTGAGGVAGGGGTGFFGGGGANGLAGPGGNGSQCSGGGGGGSTTTTGGGGGSGEYVEFSIPSPAASYGITVGGTAAGGAAGTQAGGSGGPGLIIVSEFYLRALPCEAANDNDPVDLDSCKAA